MYSPKLLLTTPASAKRETSIPLTHNAKNGSPRPLCHMQSTTGAMRLEASERAMCTSRRRAERMEMVVPDILGGLSLTH